MLLVTMEFMATMASGNNTTSVNIYNLIERIEPVHLSCGTIGDKTCVVVLRGVCFGKSRGVWLLLVMT